MEFNYLTVAEKLESACRAAGALLLEIQSSAKIILEKGSGDFALDADLLSQKILKDYLNASFPDVSIVAEEDIPVENFQVPDNCFLIDPLDGTLIYSRGYSDWGVMISLVVNSEPVVSCVYLPARELCVRAIKGQGVSLNGKQVEPKVAHLSDITFLGFDIFSSQKLESLQKVVKALEPRQVFVRSVGSAASATLDLILGRTDLLISNGGAKIWDIAPLALAGAELGMIAKDSQGKPLKWNQLPMTFILAASDELLKAALLRGQASPFEI